MQTDITHHLSDQDPILADIIARVEIPDLEPSKGVYHDLVSCIVDQQIPAHGGKNSTPFTVPTRVYDETIHALTSAVEKARIGDGDKSRAIAKLTKIAQRAENDFEVKEPDFKGLLDKENRDSHQYGGRSIKGWAKPEKKLPPKDDQLSLF